MAYYGNVWHYVRLMFDLLYTHGKLDRLLYVVDPMRKYEPGISMAVVNDDGAGAESRRRLHETLPDIFDNDEFKRPLKIDHAPMNVFWDWHDTQDEETRKWLDINKWAFPSIDVKEMNRVHIEAKEASMKE